MHPESVSCGADFRAILAEYSRSDVLSFNVFLYVALELSSVFAVRAAKRIFSFDHLEFNKVINLLTGHAT